MTEPAPTHQPGTASPVLVTVRCGTGPCRRTLGEVIRTAAGVLGVQLTTDAAEGAEWLAETGHTVRVGNLYTLPAAGLVPIAPCRRHTRWRGPGGQLRTGTIRQRETSAGPGVSVTALRTAYLDAARLHQAVAMARRSGRTYVLAVGPDDYAAAEQLEPRREMWQNDPG